MAPATPVNLVDAAGTLHAAAAGEPRIVSLVPSVTELLFDLELEAALVGRTTFCVRPPGAVDAKPSVGGTKKINFKKLAALAPTHVIVNVDETPKHLAERIADAGISVVVTHPIEVRDNLELYRLMGGIFRREAQARRLCARFEAAYKRLESLAGGWPARDVLYLIWQDPWMTVSRDTYVSRMLALANWRTAGDDAGVRYPEVAIDTALLAGIDLVLFSTEPFAFDESHVEAFRRAYPGARPHLALIDGQMTSWYGSRAIEGLDYMAALAAAQA